MSLRTEAFVGFHRLRRHVRALSNALNKYICDNYAVTVCPCIDNCWKNLAVCC
jgi:hypothetical protein